MAAEEGDGSRVRAGLGQGHDGGPEAAGPGSEPHRSWRWGLPVPADARAQAAGGGPAGPQQHPGESPFVNYGPKLWNTLPMKISI